MSAWLTDGRWSARIAVWALTKISGLLYGPIWLTGSEWCDEMIRRLERWGNEER